MNKIMKQVLDWAKENVKQGGGPFAAAVVKNGKIVSIGLNRVTQINDPTAHAEVTAIREACKKLKTFDLSNCEIVSSCEPCPMCLGAIYWARLKVLWFGSTRHDAAEIGFDDSFIYEETKKSYENRAIPTRRIITPNMLDPFNEWKNTQNKIEY